MVEKIRFGGEWTPKKIVAAVLFGAIIVVFAFWGKQSGMGSDAGAVAATVNNTAITLSQYHRSAEAQDEEYRSRMDSLPEAAKNKIRTDLHRKVLRDLVVEEVIYQAAQNHGVVASDAQVKDQILQIPWLQENGRFLGDRYRQFLQSRNMSAEEFERIIRKEIVNQKVQELFAGSAAPSREEMRLNRLLANQKLSLHYVEVTHDEIKKMGNISDQEVAAYVPAHKSDIEAFYKENKIDFTQPEKYRARDILIRVDQKRSDADAAKLAAEIRKEVTAKNFAAVAAKKSEDPGSKAKGGDLGEIARGSMLPEFETAALALQPGQISAPVKAEGGYHLILLESKTPGGTLPLEKAEATVARRLIARSKEGEIVNKLRETVEKGDRKDIDSQFSRAGLKWQDTGEFDLTSNNVPKLGDAKDVMSAVIKQGPKGGLVHQLLPFQGGFLVVDAAPWKQLPDTSPEVEGMDRMMAYRKAQGLYDSWIEQVEGQASIQVNNQLIR
jgi:peptidyl-prolyl cis-trans isomerase D